MKFVLGAVFVLVSLSATPVSAAPVVDTLEVSGWMPYWRVASSTADVAPNLAYITTVHPFSFEVERDGALRNTLNIESRAWTTFIEEAREAEVRVVPSILWTDAEAMHRVLGNSASREKLVTDIVSLVERYNFDGIDIDFEAKWAETNQFFSAFLQELYGAIGKKWLYCTIESRTPLESRFDTIPANIEYANDYEEINRYCDRVQIMAYDQGTIDLTLSRAAAGPYVPISDVRWAEKVMREALKTISKDKLVLGIPTYGYEYEVEPLSLHTFMYKRLWAFNPRYALEIARTLELTPTRNMAGELQVLYLPQMLESDNAPKSASVLNLGVPATALSNVATAPATRPTFNLMTWSDAEAIAQKIALAEQLQLAGVAIFKLDGGQDQGLWPLLRGE